MFKKIFLSERIMMGAIVLNAFVIFLLAFPELYHHPVLVILDHIFIVIFVIEAATKIATMGWRAYFKDGWNKFDFLIVVCSVPELAQDFIPVFGTAGSFILIFRLFRLIRLLRFVKFVPNMQHILLGLKRAFKASLFVLAALFFMNFMLAVLTTYMYGKVVPQYFGDPLTSAFTIFQMFTLEGWNEIPTAIAKAGLSNWGVTVARLYFVFVVLSGGIFGMSLANAVFVDEMTMDNNRGLEDKIDLLQEKIDKLQVLLEQNDKE